MAAFETFEIKEFNSNESSFITAEELLDKTRAAGKTNREWTNFAPVNEIVKTCTSPNFPQKIREEIADIILEQYVNHRIMMLCNQWQCYEPISATYATLDERAVVKCLNISKNAKLKAKFFRAIIKYFILRSYQDNRRMFASGMAHERFEKAWTSHELRDLENREASGEEIDYFEWRADLERRYWEDYLEAEKENLFEHDFHRSYGIIREFVVGSKRLNIMSGVS
ncbi:hypothetical protein IJH16_01255 [Candidatus Saccharibacteria bacterium]|nr:hypothetical protein [Candidatus Saccharibacteria bacterium]